MKHVFQLPAAIITTSLGVLAGQSAQAAVLIDYNDGVANGIHNASVNNGGFEDATNTDWVGTGDVATVSILSNNNEPTVGGDNAVLGFDTFDTTDGSQHPGQDTGHIIALGDQFSGSYAWRDAYAWNLAVDTIDFVLFYTADDTIGGARTELFTFNSGLAGTLATWEDETLALTSGVADGGAVGKTLFVALEVDVADNLGFTRIDNVYLEVTPIPEPGSLALLGLGGLLIASRRRG